MIDKKIQGKKNRQAGARFELKVRSDLESKGWIVDRWTNNVEFERIYGEDILKKRVKIKEITWKENNKVYDEGMIGKLIKAKSFMGRSRTNGFPDFIAFKIAKIPKGYAKRGTEDLEFIHEVIGVEVKSNGYLDKTEKAKCVWYLKNNIFSKILIASKGKKRGEIEYKEFS